MNCKGRVLRLKEHLLNLMASTQLNGFHPGFPGARHHQLGIKPVDGPRLLEPEGTQDRALLAHPLERRRLNGMNMDRKGPAVKI